MVREKDAVIVCVSNGMRKILQCAVGHPRHCHDCVIRPKTSGFLAPTGKCGKNIVVYSSGILDAMTLVTSVCIGI